MILATDKFGEIEYNLDDIILISKGLLGFDDLTKFIFIDQPEYNPFRWLQSIEQKEISLLIASPDIVASDFSLNLLEKLKGHKELEKDGDFNIFIPIIIPSGKPAKIYANMKAPIMVNQINNNAVQLVLGNNEYEIDYPIFDRLII